MDGENKGRTDVENLRRFSASCLYAEARLQNKTLLSNKSECISKLGIKFLAKQQFSKMKE